MINSKAFSIRTNQGEIKSYSTMPMLVYKFIRFIKTTPGLLKAGGFLYYCLYYKMTKKTATLKLLSVKGVK